MMAKTLEAAMEEERREILVLLESQHVGKHARGSTSSSGSGGRASSPFSYPRSPIPIRSMLDIDGEPPHRLVRSNGPLGSPIRNLPPRTTQEMNNDPPPPSVPIRSMLDIDGEPPHRYVRTNGQLGRPPKTVTVRSMLEGTDASPQSPGLSKNAQSSPTHLPMHVKAKTKRPPPETIGPTTSYIPHVKHAQHRSLSDTPARPGFGPRSGSVPDIETSYQFSGFPSTGHIAPKRNSIGGKKLNAMAEVVRGGDFGQFGMRDRGRNHSIAGTGIGASKSKSPHNRLSLRSSSPHLKNDSSKFQLDDGTVIDMSNAYRRLSDANLIMSGGNLSNMVKKGALKRRKNDNYSDLETRLEKDYTSKNGEDAVADSSDDGGRSSDADDERPRGRKKNSRSEKKTNFETQTVALGNAKGPRVAQSQMAAAEEERIQVSGKQQPVYHVRSLIDPEITITAPPGDRTTRSIRSGSGVHPNTSFDEIGSGFNTPFDSDTEADLTDIKRAQKLSVNMTPIVSTPATSRCVRTIYRGDFAQMQTEAHENQRRVRKYLVATDLSDEAAHALEWTIGTVLRDGDTLLAIYCVDEELGIAPNDASGDDLNMAAQAAAIVASAKSAVSTPILTATPIPSPLGPGMRLDSSASASPDGRERGKAEQERYRAVQDITERVSKLLRKTKLQVKIVIEVIHCKSPKHLITEVIDYISPTLVILGSRGRSALKGVILGSFSNYLVTKSSVPVMVARKRLRKHSKYRRPAIRLANNLANPSVKSLAAAKID